MSSELTNQNFNQNLSKNQNKTGKSLVWMAIVYLLGLFIGAIDTGIITPARPIIQNELGVDANLGIWMITIYTLTYAAIIPISGKLADLKGRKPVYLLSIALFGIGSCICASSAVLDSFLVLMIGRIVQASGAGGIMPVATAEFGTSFPEEKRGMALGMVGAVYGIANVLGASVGSAVLDIAGTSQWQWIFLINVPICIFIVISGIIALPNNKADETKAMDKLGTLLMTLIILSLLYGLKNLDFFDFINSISSKNVWPFLVISIVLLPLFVVVERRAEDPVFHIEYAGNRQIMITLSLGVVVGCSMMGMIFIPQFAENALKIAAGSGGYFVIILGFCAGGASMGSGKMIDKKGAKVVMAAGFIITIIGCLYLSFVAVRFVNLINVIVALVLIGLGLGLTMGTPLNYMMLQNTDDEESNSALATLSLVRSIGTAVAPAIMVGFIVHASTGLQSNLMEILPKEVEIPQLPYAQEIDRAFDKYKDNEEFAKQLEGVDMPKLSEMSTVEINMEGDAGSDYEMPAELLEEFQNSDVTTIAATTEKLVRTMFDDMSPTIAGNIDSGIDSGIKGIKNGINGMEDAYADMKEGYNGIGEGISGMTTAIEAQDSAINQLYSAEDMMKDFKDGFPDGMNMLSFIPEDAQKAMPKDTLNMLAQVENAEGLQKIIDGMDAAAGSMESAKDQIDNAIGMMAQFPDGKIPGGKTLIDFIPEPAQASMPAETVKMLSQIDDVTQLEARKEQLEGGIAAQKQGKTQLKKALSMLKSLEEGKIPDGMSFVDFIPADVRSSMPESVNDQLSEIKTTQDLTDMIGELEGARAEVAKKLKEAKSSQEELGGAMKEMKGSIKDMKTLSKQMKAMKKAVPDALNKAGEDYAASVAAMSTEIEDVYQSTMNVGYRNMYLFLVGVNILGLLLLAFYREARCSKVSR